MYAFPNCDRPDNQPLAQFVTGHHTTCLEQNRLLLRKAQ